MRSNNINKYIALLAVVTLVFSSCQEEDLFGGNKYGPAKPGDEIVFGGSMNYETNGKSRTVYGDKTDTGTEIKWLVNDAVRIYCAQASGVTSCDYQVQGAFSGTGQITGNGDDAAYETCSLARYEGTTVGLQWGTGEHEFYGVYPSPKQFGDNPQGADLNAQSALKLVGNELTGFLPAMQYPSQYVAKSGTTYTIHPAMRYAYMVAAGKGEPKNGSVSMLFVPVVAAVEMTLVNNNDATVENIDMITLTSTEGNAICGNFTTTIAMKSDGTTDITNSINNNSETDEAYKSVSIPVYQEVTNDGTTTTEMVDLAKGESIKFTVFMLLDDDDANKALDGLKVSIRAGGITKEATISGVDVVQAKKKNFINGVGVNIQNQITLDYSKWMEALDETNIGTLSPLSVPGAGGAWSGNKNSDGSYVIGDTYRQQNLTFDELWDCGIRCFEAQVDARLTYLGSWYINKDFTNKYIYCNGKSTGVKFTDAVQALRKKVYENKDSEFAFLIVTYYEEGGFSERNSGGWQQAINEVLNGMTESTSSGLCGVKLWTPTTTLADAKGKLFIIARPGAIGVDYGWHGLATGNSNIVSILGWGSMPDQWYARGYGKLERFYSGDGTNTTYNVSTVNTLTGYRPFTAPTGTTAEVISDEMYKSNLESVTKDFGYYAVSSSTALYGGLCKENGTNTTTKFVGQNAYVQEWRRVVNGDFTYYDSNKGRTYFWKSNIDEKWNDIVTALDKSMNRGSEGNNYDYYINSLCGYFVTSDEKLSYYPAVNVQRYNNSEKAVYCDGIYQSEVEGSFFISDFSVSNYGPYDANGGDAGDIKTYASWVNNKFYNHLQGLMTSSGGLGGKPTGIVLMDRVSNTTDDMAGLNIARIIIANNFEGSNVQNASVMRLSLLDGDQALDTDDSDGVVDQIAAPQRRK